MNQSIQWQNDDGLCIPRFVCAACNKPIDDTTLANIEWRDYEPYDPDKPITAIPIGKQPWRVIHKAAFCAAAAADRNAKNNPWSGSLWEDLIDFLRYIIFNTLSDEEMRRLGIQLHKVEVFGQTLPARGGKPSRTPAR